MQSTMTFRGPDKVEYWEMGWPGNQTKYKNLTPQGMPVMELGPVPSAVN